ncbi:sulfate/molybdate ABC transporter ATP-binding protein [Pseudonocardia sp. Cha107L01]|uniref:sulfate/molybdate ABC transporter ATP-binding protein n=1 Tax=Pseudonocardia sp. Cha107L01 TaxID=3457576 RepID=UPI00403E371B
MSTGAPTAAEPTGRGGFLELTASVRRREFTLDVSLTVARGEIVAVLGPNGAGKSTLLGVLAGLLRPDEGRVVLDGRTLTDTGSGVHVPTHQRGVGLLAQQALLFPHLTAVANVAFGPRCHGVSKRAAADRARDLLAEVDVAELGRRRPSQLSGGQAQRVALARALAGEPELLLLDEPLAALDIDSAPALRALLRRVVRGPDGGVARTALLVTHDVLDALVLADRVVVLTGGSIVEQGATRDVLTRPRSPFAARIAGLNLVPGLGAPGGLRTADGTVVAGLHTGEDPVAGAPAVAVFPPAAVAVFRDRPHGSPRNVVQVRLAGMEPRGEVVRLRAEPLDGGPAWVAGLAADVTPGAVADLGAAEPLSPGVPLWYAVKATEVQVHPAVR